MYTNQCTKCNKVFETKNPKRIVCPECLYLNKASEGSYDSLVGSEGSGPPRQTSFGGGPRQGGGGYGPRPQQGGGGYGGPRQGGGGYGPRPQQGGGGYGAPRQGGGGYGPRPQQGGGGYGGPRQGGGGYGGPRQGGGGYGGPRQGGGGYGGPRQGGFGGQRGPRPMGGRPGPGGPPRKLLFPREVMMDIEKRYKDLLPLPNPDAHVKIAEAINIPAEEAMKVFFAINVIRQKMRLPKLDVPKRPLAVSFEQLEAVKTLYVPYLPLPPIGIHKIIAKQLRMDEWRVHVAIGLVRKQEGMERWNEGREDIPEKMKAELEELRKRQAEAKTAEAANAEKPAEKAKDEEAKPAETTEEAPTEA